MPPATDAPAWTSQHTLSRQMLVSFLCMGDSHYTLLYMHVA